MILYVQCNYVFNITAEEYYVVYTGAPHACQNKSY